MARKRCGWPPQPGPYNPGKPPASTEAASKETNQPESNPLQATNAPLSNNGDPLPATGAELLCHEQKQAASVRLWVLGSPTERISAYLVQLGQVNVLLDAGWASRGRGLTALLPAGVTPGDIAAVVISHAHTDHMMGLLDLQRSGLRCKIFCSEPTCELLKISLPDAAKFWENRKEGKQTASECLLKLSPQNYGSWFKMAPGVRVRLHHAGHLIGGVITEVELDAGTEKIKLCYTGDLGIRDDSYLRAPALLPSEAPTDYLIIGTPRPDKTGPTARKVITQVINDAVLRAGQVGDTEPGVILFMVGSLGEGPIVLRELAYLQSKELIPPHLPMLAFGSLIQASTQVNQAYLASAQSYMVFLAEILRMYRRKGISPFLPVHYSDLLVSREVFTQIRENQHSEPIVLISAGKSYVGRQLLESLLPKRQNTVVFSRLSQTADSPQLWESAACYIEVLPPWLLDTHGDEQTLAWWLKGSFPTPPRQTLVVHGNSESKALFASNLQNQGWNVHIPSFQECVELGP